MAKRKPKKLIKPKTVPIDIYDFSVPAGSFDLSGYLDPNSPYYSSISTTYGTTPMTYTLPSIDTKDKKKSQVY